MLFYGPPGTGKTSTILALTKELYGPSLSKSRVLELNASDERGISIVREKVKNFARLTVSNPTADDLSKYPCPPYKIIILDEADSMTADAQSALRRTMETYSNVTRFCLVCNYITRIIDPLASRCSKFRFKPLDDTNALQRLEYISSEEGLKIKEDSLREVLKIANGDLRKAITFLQSASKLQINGRTPDGDQEMEDGLDTNDGTEITVTSIREIAGSVPSEMLDDLIKVTASRNLNKIIKYVNDFILQGWSAVEVTNQIHDKLILSDFYSNSQKNQISYILFETDKRLTSGTDEHIQLLNTFIKISEVL
jgi:replication factor C subunit 2/4